MYVVANSLDTLNSKEISLTSKEVEGSSLGSSISSSQIVCLVYLSICRVVKAWYNVLNLKQWRRKLRRNFFSSQSSDEKNEASGSSRSSCFSFYCFSILRQQPSIYRKREGFPTVFQY